MMYDAMVSPGCTLDVKTIAFLSFKFAPYSPIVK